MNIEKEIKEYLLKIPNTESNFERDFYIKQSINQFSNVYLYLESRNDYTEEDVSEGQGNLFNTFAQGYWSAGFVAGEIFWGFAERLYDLWITKTLQFQEKHEKRIHKGMAYNQIGWINYHYYKNNPKAYNFYLYALVEDIISERDLFPSAAFIALTTSFFQLPKEKVFIIKDAILKPNINKMVPEEIITKISKTEAVPTYDEVSNVDIQGLTSLSSRWEKLKKEHKKNKKS